MLSVVLWSTLVVMALSYPTVLSSSMNIIQVHSQETGPDPVSYGLITIVYDAPLPTAKNDESSWLLCGGVSLRHDVGCQGSPMRRVADPGNNEIVVCWRVPSRHEPDECVLNLNKEEIEVTLDDDSFHRRRIIPRIRPKQPFLDKETKDIAAAFVMIEQATEVDAQVIFDWAADPLVNIIAPIAIMVAVQVILPILMGTLAKQLAPLFATGMTEALLKHHGKAEVKKKPKKNPISSGPNPFEVTVLEEVTRGGQEPLDWSEMLDSGANDTYDSSQDFQDLLSEQSTERISSNQDSTIDHAAQNFWLEHDSDRSDSLNREEVLKFIQLGTERFTDSSPDATLCIGEAVPGVMDFIFEMLDSDEDGVLSRLEVERGGGPGPRILEWGTAKLLQKCVSSVSSTRTSVQAYNAFRFLDNEGSGILTHSELAFGLGVLWTRAIGLLNPHSTAVMECIDTQVKSGVLGAAMADSVLITDLNVTSANFVSRWSIVSDTLREAAENCQGTLGLPILGGGALVGAPEEHLVSDEIMGVSADHGWLWRLLDHDSSGVVYVSDISRTIVYLSRYLESLYPTAVSTPIVECVQHHSTNFIDQSLVNLTHQEYSKHPHSIIDSAKSTIYACQQWYKLDLESSGLVFINDFHRVLRDMVLSRPNSYHCYHTKTEDAAQKIQSHATDLELYYDRDLHFGVNITEFMTNPFLLDYEAASLYDWLVPCSLNTSTSTPNLIQSHPVWNRVRSVGLQETYDLESNPDPIALWLLYTVRAGEGRLTHAGISRVLSAILVVFKAMSKLSTESLKRVETSYNAARSPLSKELIHIMDLNKNSVIDNTEFTAAPSLILDSALHFLSSSALWELLDSNRDQLVSQAEFVHGVAKAVLNTSSIPEPCLAPVYSVLYSSIYSYKTITEESFNVDPLQLHRSILDNINTQYDRVLESCASSSVPGILLNPPCSSTGGLASLSGELYLNEDVARILRQLIQFVSSFPGDTGVLEAENRATVSQLLEKLYTLSGFPGQLDRIASLLLSKEDFIRDVSVILAPYKHGTPDDKDTLLSIVELLHSFNIELLLDSNHDSDISSTESLHAFYTVMSVSLALSTHQSTIPGISRFTSLPAKITRNDIYSKDQKVREYLCTLPPESIPVSSYPGSPSSPDSPSHSKSTSSLKIRSTSSSDSGSDSGSDSRSQSTSPPDEDTLPWKWDWEMPGLFDTKGTLCSVPEPADGNIEDYIMKLWRHYDTNESDQLSRDELQMAMHRMLVCWKEYTSAGIHSDNVYSGTTALVNPLLEQIYPAPVSLQEFHSAPYNLLNATRFIIYEYEMWEHLISSGDASVDHSPSSISAQQFADVIHDMLFTSNLVIPSTAVLTCLMDQLMFTGSVLETIYDTNGIPGVQQLEFFKDPFAVRRAALALFEDCHYMHPNAISLGAPIEDQKHPRVTWGVLDARGLGYLDIMSIGHFYRVLLRMAERMAPDYDEYSSIAACIRKSIPQLSLRVFEGLDTNKDHRVTEDEFSPQFLMDQGAFVMRNCSGVDEASSFIEMESDSSTGDDEPTKPAMMGVTIATSIVSQAGGPLVKEITGNLQAVNKHSPSDRPLVDTTQELIANEMYYSLSKSLTVSLTQSVSTGFLQEVVEPMQRLTTATAIHGLSGALTNGISATVARAMRHDPMGDYYCALCQKTPPSYCELCKAALQNDYYLEHYTSHYANYYSNYYSAFYATSNNHTAVFDPAMLVPKT